MDNSLKRALIIVLVFVLIVSMGACGNKKSASENDETDTGPDVTQETEDTGDTEEPESGQDLSWVVDQADWRPMFPEYEDSIVWTAIPKDFIGGFGTQVNPKQDNTGYVNVREKPSIEAKVIGEIHHDSNVVWVVIDETYKINGQLMVGSYKVKNGDYTWLPVTNGNGVDSIQGWAAMEVLELWAI